MSGTPIRVIVVDDEPVIRQFLQVALADMGAHVETFSTCADGLERCRLVDFDVAFVDKNLPDGTGLQICAALTGADCKVALITGYANLHSAVEAMRHGVADYFIKPLDLDDLEARFQRMTKQLHLERANRSLLANLVAKCRELERLAARDTVTGLFNHTHFQTQLRSEISKYAGPNGAHLGIALTEVNSGQFEDTQPNADGVLPHLIADAGFADAAERRRIHTLTGTIAIFTAHRRQTE